MKWNIRVFTANPGGAYDPAPLQEFDDETEGFIPVTGDLIRYDESGPCYKVIARHFDYATNRCAIEVKEVDTDWPYF